MPEAEVGSPAAARRLVQSFCSIGTILPSRPARSPCRRAQRWSRMARLRATASAARSVLDGCEHDGMLSRVGSRLPKLTNRTIKRRETKHIKKQDHAHAEHANRWGELGPAGIIEHETRGAPSRIVITKSWHKDCLRSIPLFDPETIPSPRPGAQFAAARSSRQGRPSRQPCRIL